MLRYAHAGTPSASRQSPPPCCTIFVHSMAAHLSLFRRKRERKEPFLYRTIITACPKHFQSFLYLQYICYLLIQDLAGKIPYMFHVEHIQQLSTLNQLHFNLISTYPSTSVLKMRPPLKRLKAAYSNFQAFSEGVYIILITRIAGMVCIIAAALRPAYSGGRLPISESL